MKNNPQTNPTNPQANRTQSNQPIHHQSNCLKRYLNRITKDNKSIILYDKEPKSKWKIILKIILQIPKQTILQAIPQTNLQIPKQIPFLNIISRPYQSTYQDYPTEHTIKITANLPNQPNIQWSSTGYRKS